MVFEEFNNFDEAFSALLSKLDFKINEPFNDVKKVLCIEPHPDDCAIGLGGTIKKLTDSGIDVVYLLLTDGSMGTTDGEVSGHELALRRLEEEKRSAEILGVKKIHALDFGDTELPYTREVRKEIVTVIRKERPGIVLMPDPWLPYEGHPDHRHAGFLGIEAVSFAGLPNFNRSDLIAGLDPHSIQAVGFYYTHKPNYFVDISDVMEVKLRAVRTHESQFPEDVWELWEPYLRTIALYYGKMSGHRYAEGIRFVPGIFLHICPFAHVI
ncbi:N-acetylchitobiose deacetylase [Thermococcus kodakarensis KOD1]|uniref:Diacetylchitobiose deacetylase n=1 Tax=Thermococcus kodakarensis (strain ATCC BAA-918 / JCM 12380 / KOD1) TaxID=69014 RepID=DCHI_THEKO|nr:PIG-L deacetylase family protein [Thermococcus kodakarensis]Q6F4N1.1 RecName: Full=Diacetylchitobiose deacetylase; AltName: Full=N-acetylchitobiose deacetylase; AltName: Full=Tk-Dac [Thermococcus kodakarensis KOD1]WCN29392.1 PIG-L family deacetylase [Thermococcus kodakarensis]WCN29969.1 PIG-L family deacetylase [Thermococcus kodakarensis]BAD29713.1 diacetylchitobiose deacetylase [Thermococcus kodakarensis]BAD85953.1 N-acetylchitobiose deacetylase [Thermococcus kodakarensis KOD1]